MEERIAAGVQTPRGEPGAHVLTRDCCLFLDVDGTLLEIAPTPDAVRADEPLVELLLRAEAALGGALALVSGRPIEALDALFAPRRGPAAGLHGLERRDAAGVVHVSRPPGDPSFDAARRALTRLAEATPGVLIEDKGATLALHCRAVPDEEPELRRVMHEIASGLGDGYHVLEGKRVLELKPAGVSKADAIRAFMTEHPFLGRRPVFVGDDITDLDGFAAAEEAGGLSVAVGSAVNARRRVASPREVRALLEDLVERRPLPA